MTAWGSNPVPSFSARMSPSAECGHWSIFTPRQPERLRSAPRPAPGPDAAAPRSRPPARRCADPPAHVAMTMQSLLSPAADMPSDWLWAAMCCRLCCKTILSMWARNIDSRSRTAKQLRLNEAAGAALKLLHQWECQRHPRRWSARLEGIDQCSLINDDGDQHDRDTSKGR
jgi:hypothetical protein